MKRTGFTLLEVLITSIVMVLLVLSAYPTLQTASRRQEQVTNMALLETCMVQGIATAKSPTLATTATVHITFTTSPIGCTVAEADAAGTKTTIATSAIANPSSYILSLTPTVTNNEYIISTNPPYQFTVPGPTIQLMMVSLRTVAAPVTVNSTFFNLITGTINARSS